MSQFLPSVERAKECRLAMDASLWSSARELIDALPPVRDQGDGASEAGGPARMLDYGAYFDLALVPPTLDEVPQEARQEAAAHLRRRLAQDVASHLVPSPPRISAFSTSDYTPAQIERFRRWWDIEPANHMAMIEPTEDDVARARRIIPDALARLHDAAPELHDEILIIVRDIVISRPDGINNLINYSGASSFALWGGLTVNGETHHEWIQFCRQIVHEAGHNLLFAIARDEPLVTNDPSERAASAIRADLRPMDGIYHAAFVTAREVLAFEALLCRHEETGNLSEDDLRIVEDLLVLSVTNFWSCVETLRTGGARLTGLGEAVLSDCENWMRENFAIEPA
jgi:HEXXH motif-containing protein